MGKTNKEHEMWLKISKDEFKFSSAHMSYMSAQDKEALHGHNYYVTCSFCISASENRTFIDFARLKKILRGLCQIWDEKILLASDPTTTFVDQGLGQVRLKTHGVEYVFPLSEVVVLQTKNIIIENLSVLFLDNLSRRLMEEKIFSPEHGPVFKIKVTIEETRGQSVEITC